MIAVVDYDAGNIGSVANALKRLGAEFDVTSSPSIIKSADGVIFPGQGRAGPAMKSLRRSGLDELLPKLNQPFLGICLGMQLMVERMEEDNEEGLGIIPGGCDKLRNITPIPHMGWNQVEATDDPTLFNGLKNNFYQYFVHSYALKTSDEFVIGKTDYGIEFASAVAKDNFYGVQFHPEKSAETGEKILKNFLILCGETK